MTPALLQQTGTMAVSTVFTLAGLEVMLAAVLPPVASLILVRTCSRDRGLRCAGLLFAVLTMLWFAPVWATLGTPVSLDFLLDSPPLEASKPPGYLQKNFLLNDIPLQLLPWREAAVRAWRAGELPFLDRHTASGTPLWENLQTAVLYPPNLVSIPFSTFAWPLFVVSAKVVAGLLGMYLLLRQLGRTHVPSLFGAIAWGFGAFTISYAMFPLSSVTSLLPLLMFFFVRRAAGDRRAVVWAAVTLAVMVTGGHPESLFHCALVAVPWCGLLVFRNRGQRRSLLTDYCVAGIIALLVTAPLLLPFLAYLPHAQRLGDLASNEGFLWTPPLDFESIVAFVIPNYFGNPIIQNYRHPFNFNELCSQFVGLTALGFSIVALILRARHYIAGMTLFLVLFLLSTQPLWLQEVVKSVPVFGVTAHSRLRFALAFLIAIAAADGFHLFLTGVRRQVAAFVAGGLFLIVAVVCLVSYPVFAQYGVRRLVFFTELAALMGCAFVVLMARRYRAIAGPVLVALLYLDLFAVVGLYNPRNGRELYYPSTPSIAAMDAGEGPYRIAGIDRALQPNQAVFHGLEDIRPHDPMAFLPYVRLLDRAGLNRTSYFEMFDDVPPRPLLDFLGVRFVIMPGATETPLPLVYGGAESHVHENPGFLPRYFVPRSVEGSQDPLSSFLSSDDVRRVFAESEHKATPASIQLSSYTPSSATLTVDASEDTFVASSEVALPGWRLERDGHRWPLTTINGVFVGWRVPRGHSEFVMRYEPLLLRESAAVSAVGFMLLATWWYRRRRVYDR